MQGFRSHSLLLTALQKLSNISSNIQLESYGETYEGRPLILAYLSSEENLTNKEQIRRTHLHALGLEVHHSNPSKRIPIVWMSYNVHGDEASASEAALKTIEYLVSHQSSLLNQMMVIIDPCANPDGYDAYVSWYKRHQAYPPNPDPNAAEHLPPWAHPRNNHYMIDLNRDLAWLTQKESIARIHIYQQWIPHVHIDFHEMYPNASYYFGPGAKPRHDILSSWQNEFQELLYQNHSRHFGPRNWRYYGNEHFDLFYPGYGDMYPLLNGAIGITYEMAGKVGLRYRTKDGNILTFEERVERHHVAALSSLETVLTHANRLITEQIQFFTSPPSQKQFPYTSYLIKTQELSPHTLQHFLNLLTKHRIQYGQLTSQALVQAFSYQTNKEEELTIQPHDILIPSDQPQVHLLHALLEPNPRLEEAVTYDVSAWSLLYAYNLDAYAIQKPLSIQRKKLTLPTPIAPIEKAFGYIAEWNDVKDVKLLAALLQAKIKVRRNHKPFTYKNKTFKRGSIIILQEDNPELSQLGVTVKEIAIQQNQAVYAIDNPSVQKGIDFGSSNTKLTKAPKVAILMEQGVKVYRYADLWFYFEQSIAYPFTPIPSFHINKIDLRSYDIVICPNGSYESTHNVLTSFVKQGGTLLCMGSAITSIVKEESLRLAKRFQEVKEEKEKQDKEQKADFQIIPFEKKGEQAIHKRSMGSIHQVRIDATHPYAFGFGDTFFIMKQHKSPIPMFKPNQVEKGCWNIGGFMKGHHHAGFIGESFKQSLNQSLFLGEETYGKGKFIYLSDSVNFRCFWHSGELLLGNIIFGCEP